MRMLVFNQITRMFAIGLNVNVSRTDFFLSRCDDFFDDSYGCYSLSTGGMVDDSITFFEFGFCHLETGVVGVYV